MGDRMEEKEVDIDFSPLFDESAMFAVYCKTEEDAKHFLKCLRKAYPQKCRTWEPEETHWGKYNEICYRPNLNTTDEYTLKYCSLEHYEEMGFVIIHYEDLLVYADIPESEQSINLLIGGGV